MPSVEIVLLLRALLSSNPQRLRSVHILLTNVMPDCLRSGWNAAVVTNHLVIVKFQTQILDVAAQVFYYHISLLIDLVLDVNLLVVELAVQVPDEFVFEVVQLLGCQGF